MNKELEGWFETFWGTWNKRWFTGQCKGSKARAKIELDKIAPDTKLLEQITWYQQELQLRYSKMAGQAVAKACGKAFEIPLFRR